MRLRTRTPAVLPVLPSVNQKSFRKYNETISEEMQCCHGLPRRDELLAASGAGTEAPALDLNGKRLLHSHSFAWSLLILLYRCLRRVTL